MLTMHFPHKNSSIVPEQVSGRRLWNDGDSTTLVPKGVISGPSGATSELSSGASSKTVC